MAWAPDYITLEQIKVMLKIDAVDTADDDDLETFITAASRAIDRHAGRQFGSVAAAVARTYPAEWRPDRGRWVVVIDDLQTVTDLAIVNDDDDAVTGYRLMPRNAAADGLPWTRVELSSSSTVLPVSPDYELTVTARWGWTAVPAEVVAACKLQTSRFFARRESPYGVAGSPDLGSEVRLLAKLDADVAVQLANVVRPKRAR